MDLVNQEIYFISKEDKAEKKTILDLAKKSYNDLDLTDDENAIEKYFERFEEAFSKLIKSIDKDAKNENEKKLIKKLESKKEKLQLAKAIYLKSFEKNKYKVMLGKYLEEITNASNVICNKLLEPEKNNLPTITSDYSNPEKLKEKDLPQEVNSGEEFVNILEIKCPELFKLVEKIDKHAKKAEESDNKAKEDRKENNDSEKKTLLEEIEESVSKAIKDGKENNTAKLIKGIALEKALTRLWEMRRYKDETGSVIAEQRWLEHRRWNAFLRSKGYVHNYEHDKNLELCTHNCLAECYNDSKDVKEDSDKNRRAPDKLAEFYKEDPENKDYKKYDDPLLFELYYGLQEYIDKFPRYHKYP